MPGLKLSHIFYPALLLTVKMLTLKKARSFSFPAHGGKSPARRKKRSTKDLHVMTAAQNNINKTTGTFVSAGPIVTSVLCGFATSIPVQHFSSRQDFNSALIFSGWFDLLLISTVFLAIFYLFVVTEGNDFLKKIKTTSTYRMLLKLLRFTILWSALMIVFSHILMIVEPKDYQLFSGMHLIVFLWMTSMFLTVLNFIRCVRYFLIIVEHPD